MYHNQNTWVCWDGHFVKADQVRIDPFSQSLHYGNGVFEGLRAYPTPDGPRIFKARQHFERFARSAERMGLPLAYSTNQLITLTYELLRKNHLRDAYIRPLLFAGENMALTAPEQSHLLIGAWRWGRLLGDSLVHLTYSSYRRPAFDAALRDTKVCGQYYTAVLATSEARRKGFHEAIMLNADGSISGAAGANLFMEKDDVLYTPPADKILPGLTRETVLDLASEEGIPVVEKDLFSEDLEETDGIFLAGTAAEIAGVARVEDHRPRMRWEDTAGYVISRKYKQLVTQSDRAWTLI
ncbi:MAG: branched-chain amino acid aminotransferase [Bacteroidetes bacterium]|nr:MAG: branched-chain amino acid aminotransferase [Bacteroidota bacterium]